MDSKLVIRQLFDRVLNAGDLDFLNEIISDDYLDHNLPSGVPSGREGVRAKVEALRNAFPDIHFSLEDTVAEGAMVAARYRWTGTQEGALMKIPPTGKKVDVTGMDFYRIQDGKIVEHWHNIDELGLLRQLGVTL